MGVHSCMMKVCQYFDAQAPFRDTEEYYLVLLIIFLPHQTSACFLVSQS